VFTDKVIRNLTRVLRLFLQKKPDLYITITGGFFADEENVLKNKHSCKHFAELDEGGRGKFR